MANGTYKGYTYIKNPSSVKDTTDYGTFSYDPLKDANYIALAKTYNANGIKASNDTLGKAASLNGGYGSSYAVSAAQQSRNEYNQQLASLIPDLENNAYTRWNADREFKSNQWYQNQSLYLDAVSANNSAAASQNSDTLARKQFAWEKKTSKSSGGSSGGSSRRRSSGSGYYYSSGSKSSSKSSSSSNKYKVNTKTSGSKASTKKTNSKKTNSKKSSKKTTKYNITAWEKIVRKTNKKNKKK